MNGVKTIKGDEMAGSDRKSLEPKMFDDKVKILAIWIMGIILGFAIVINIETFLNSISNYLLTILIASIVILYIVVMIGMIFTEGEKRKEDDETEESEEGDMLPFIPLFLFFFY